MRKLFLLVLVFLPFSVFAQEGKEKYAILLTGASFASPGNGWFEIGCRALNAKPLNKAVGGESIAITANKMAEGSLYTAEEMDEMDALVIMHVHDKDVYDESELEEDYTDYITPFKYASYAAAYDYVIKRYIAECYNLRYNRDSKYYDTAYGKPAIIVLCTHWHDARTIFNATVRKLASKWGLPLVEFDKNIGFSKNEPHPVNKEQYSLLYALDKKETDGVLYGWHPQQGQDKYIQRRMAAIFADTMQRILPLKQ